MNHRMLESLFDWELNKRLPDGTYLFNDCTLKFQMGYFSLGAKVHHIIVDYVKGTLTLNYEENSIPNKYWLHLTVGHPVKSF